MVITVTFMMETVMLLLRLLLLLTMLTLRGDEDEIMDCKIIGRLPMYVV